MAIEAQIFTILIVLHALRYAIYALRCTLYAMKYTLYATRCTLCNIRCALYAIRNTKDYVRNFTLFMQNKAKLPNTRMNVSPVLTRNYIDMHLCGNFKSKPNANPKKPNPQQFPSLIFRLRKPVLQVFR